MNTNNPQIHSISMSQSLKFLSNTYVKVCLFVLFLVAHYAVIYWVQPHWVGQGNTPDLFGPTFMVVYKGVVGVLMAYMIFRLLFGKSYQTRWFALAFAFLARLISEGLDLLSGKDDYWVLAGVLLGTLIVVAYVVFVWKEWPISFGKPQD